MTEYIDSITVRFYNEHGAQEVKDFYNNTGVLAIEQLMDFLVERAVYTEITLTKKLTTSQKVLDRMRK